MAGILIPGRGARGLRPSGPLVINRSSPQAEGLVGLWAVQRGGVVDLTGVNTPTLANVAGASALGGMAISLAGGTYVDCGTGVDVGAQLTAAAWVYGTNYDPQWCYVCGKESNSPPYGGWVIREVNGQFQFNFATTDEGSATGGTAPTGVWTHVAATYRSGLATLYVDGRSVATDTSKTGDLRAVASTQFRIGDSSSFTGRYWTGQIAQVYVSNRWRSDGEIWQLYDPRTRWDLFWQPSRRLVFDVGGGAPPAAWLSRLSLMGVG